MKYYVESNLFLNTHWVLDSGDTEPTFVYGNTWLYHNHDHVILIDTLQLAVTYVYSYQCLNDSAV